MTFEFTKEQKLAAKSFIKEVMLKSKEQKRLLKRWRALWQDYVSGNGSLAYKQESESLHDRMKALACPAERETYLAYTILFKRKTYLQVEPSAMSLPRNNDLFKAFACWLSDEESLAMTRRVIEEAEGNVARNQAKKQK